MTADPSAPEPISPQEDAAAFAARALRRVFGLDDAPDGGDPLDDVAISALLTLGPGEVLMEEGSPPDALFILLSGRLWAGRGDAIFGEVRPGETVGEVGVVSGAPRNATVRAARRSVVARIEAAAFDALVERHPRLGLAVGRTMIAREQRAARPRHPAHVPGVVCCVPLSDDVDAAAFVRALAGAGIADAVNLPSDASDADFAAAEGTGAFVIVPAGDRSGLPALLAHADEVVMLAAASADPSPGAVDAILGDALPGGPLPRRTLVLLQDADAKAPTRTAAWLDGRRVDRHFHLRRGNAGDMRRMARMLFGRAVGLALAGGGARGAAHLGAIRALAEHGIVPDVIGGTSIGAAMAAWHAMGLRGDALESATKEVFVAHGSPTSDWTIFPLISMVKGEKTRRLGRDAVHRATGHDADVEDTWSPYFAVAADFTNQKQVVMTRGPLWRALAATYAIPGVLPPVLIDGALHVDGGVVNNLPVDVLEDMGVARTIGVDLLGNPSRPVQLDAMPTGWQMLLDRFRGRKRRRYRVPGILSTILTSTVLGSLERQRRMRDRADLCLRPVLPRIGLLDWNRFEAAIDAGYESCKAQLDALPPEVLARFRTEAD
ncbi:patatin-like phospholipase family protein [Jannaschia sp. LMIT008]|uniref:patatin-like phospholipase family protein n=1 Tax=Jannaschia maritima TaxID=3032585 RepID=UPI0028115615|nr:patatin-like phospholipase family protein [Jannaschia sp. LMIT008]